MSGVWLRQARVGFILHSHRVCVSSSAGVKKAFYDTVQDLSNLCMLVRGDLTKRMLGSLVALITIDVHNRDIVEYLINDDTRSKSDFNWQMRIRYYWNADL